MKKIDFFELKVLFAATVLLAIMACTNNKPAEAVENPECLHPAWQLLIGFAEDAHARHSSNKFDLCTHSTASFLIPHSSFQRNVGLKVNFVFVQKTYLKEK